VLWITALEEAACGVLSAQPAERQKTIPSPTHPTRTSSESVSAVTER